MCLPRPGPCVPSKTSGAACACVTARATNVRIVRMKWFIQAENKEAAFDNLEGNEVPRLSEAGCGHLPTSSTLTVRMEISLKASFDLTVLRRLSGRDLYPHA